MKTVALLIDAGDAELTPAVLELLGELRLDDRRTLEVALVGNSKLPVTADPREVLMIEMEFLDRRGGDWAEFFEPRHRRVTLSAHIGVHQPDAAIYRLALSRLGLSPDLESAMLATRSRVHAEAARACGMTVWHIGDDAEWSQLPAIVATRLAQERTLGAIAT